MKLPAIDQSGCRARKAPHPPAHFPLKPCLAMACAVVWSAAVLSAIAADPAIRFVDSTSNWHPSLADQARGLFQSEPEPTNRLVFGQAADEASESSESLLRIAARWRTNLSPPSENGSASERRLEPQLADPTPPVALDAPQPLPRVDAHPNAAPREQASAPPFEALVEPKRPDLAEPAIEVFVDRRSADSHRCVQLVPLSALRASIALPEGELPNSAALACAATTPPVSDLRMTGGWGMVQHEWSATQLCHRPLYFEEVNAERYGYTPSYLLQPFISAGRFFATIPALPYKMTVDRAHDCISTLGYYRPGDCVPRRANRPPFRLTAAAVETGVLAGLILLLP